MNTKTRSDYKHLAQLALCDAYLDKSSGNLRAAREWLQVSRNWLKLASMQRRFDRAAGVQS